MEIKVLGTCCGNCDKLLALAQQAADELGLGVSVEKVSDMKEIMSYGIMSVPALVIDGEVRLSGRVPAYEDVKGLIERAR